MANSKPHIVVLGGGNGTSRLLRALVPKLSDSEIASLHALVLNADDGGSTGRLREQYGVSAMGDLTRCLLALSKFHGDVRGEEFLKALDHRFVGGDFEGHTLRNMFLAALEQTSDIDSGIAMMARLLQVPKPAGVVPTTLEPLTMRVSITHDGTEQVLGEGQHAISHQLNLEADPRWKPGDVRVSFAEGDVELNPRAADVLEQATHIIVAPGHTFGTILPTLALPALGRVLAEHPAKVIIVMTLLTTPRQTTNWTGEDFVRVYESYLGHTADAVLGNNGDATLELVEGQGWVRFAESEHPYELIQDSFISTEMISPQEGDTVPRAIVVHDNKTLQHHLTPLLTGA